LAYQQATHILSFCKFTDELNYNMNKSSGKTAVRVENLLPELTREIFLADSYHTALGETLRILNDYMCPVYSECRSKIAKSSVWIITHTLHGDDSGSEAFLNRLSGSGSEFYKPTLEVIDEVWTADHSMSDDATLPQFIQENEFLIAVCLQVAFGSGRNDLLRFFYTEESKKISKRKRVLSKLLPKIKKLLKQKHDIKEIRNSEERYRTLFMEDLNPSFIASPDGSIKECNQAFLTLFGFKSKKAALESNFNDRFTNYMHQVFFWESLQQKEQINNHEMPASALNGENVYTILKATGSYDQNSDLTEIVGYIQDITDRKKAEVALRKSEERYRSLIETTNDWVWEINENFHFTYSSLKIQTILGYELNNVLGSSILDLIPSNQREDVEKELTDLAQRQEAFVGAEQYFENSDGNIAIFETSGIPLFTNNGIFQGYRGISKDITERKKSERQIARMNDELEYKVIERTKMLQIANKELEAFSYSVSHDLRAPLRSIDGFSQALIEDYGDTLDSTATNYLSRVRSAAQRMSTLIDDMIKLAKVSRTELSKKRINLADIAESISTSLADMDPDRDAQFIIKPNLYVMGDENLMKVVLQNLLENAWKFTSKEEKTRIEVGSKSVDNQTVYFVQDNGAGFDMNYTKKLFTPFQRLHKETDFPGTGIGLSTVQRIIHRHLGKIWAEGAPGEGAVFCFTMRTTSKQSID
jgi:PAS domain S-box-containing protein